MPLHIDHVDKTIFAMGMLNVTYGGVYTRIDLTLCCMSRRNLKFTRFFNM